MSATGNAAAMREALEEIAQKTRERLIPHPQYRVDEDILALCESALSAPPRNCDVFGRVECTEAFAKELDGTEFETAEQEDAFMQENWFLFKHWLFAPTKGGAE